MVRLNSVGVRAVPFSLSWDLRGALRCGLSMAQHHLTWLEIDRAALQANLQTFRKLVGPGVTLMPVVKSNAYGHGAVLVAGIVQGTDDNTWLGVNSLDEALALRSAGLRLPILVLSHIPLGRLREAVRQRLRLTVFNSETVAGVSRVRSRHKTPLHVKLETGTNRLGLQLPEARRLAERIQRSRACTLEGYSTHFANIEDTTDHTYASAQLRKYERMVAALAASGFAAPVTHAACTAAALIFPETHRQLVRLGIGLYGLWPSRDTLISTRARHPAVELRPVASWKTRVAQVKTVSAGAFIGYGCSYRATRKTRLAVLPIGYFDGLPRNAQAGYVLVRGRRAPIRGRICMNLCMVDVTDIRGVTLEDEVVLIGAQGKERITAEQLAGWAGTIHYEIVSRINPLLPRLPV